jgi:predicted transcriptional regulator
MKFQPGNKYGRGRPKKPEIEELRKAIAEVEKTKDKNLLIYFVEKAYQNDAVLIALCKKLLPDMKAADVDVNVAGYTFTDFVKAIHDASNGRKNAGQGCML